MIETLRTLLRARAAEAEEAITDQNSLRLLAQHLRDAEADTAEARRVLAGLMARRKAEDRRREEAQVELRRRESEAGEAMAAQETALVEDLADRIVQLEDDIARAERAVAELDRRIDELRTNVGQAERKLVALASDLRAARAQQAARRADPANPMRLRAGALERAEALADRVRETNRSIEDEFAAMAELRPDISTDLDARLDGAGIATAAAARRKAVLARITPKT